MTDLRTIAPAWRIGPARGWLWPLVGLAGAALLLLCGIPAWTHDKPILAVCIAVLALALGRVVASTVPRKRAGSLRTVCRDGRWGTLIPVRPMARGTIAGFVVLAAGFFAGAAVLVYRTIEQEKPVVVVGALLLAGLGFLFWMGGLSGFRARRRDFLGVWLTPEDVVVCMGRTSTVPWAQVREFRAFSVRYADSRGIVSVIQNWIGVAVQDPAAMPGVSERAATLSRRFGPGLVAILPIKRFAVDPQVALELLRFYLDHPDARTELSTSGGLSRFDR